MEKVYHYPLWIRLWHGINAIMILLLIISGFSLQYSDTFLSIFSFKAAISVHNVCGIVLSINYLLFFFGNIFTSNGNFYRFNYKNLVMNNIKQFRYYVYGMFTGQKKPFPLNKDRKFNPLQKLAYSFTMYVFVPLLFVTGFALLFPEVIPSSIFNFSGIFVTATLHILLGFIVTLFLVVHLYFCTLGPTPSSFFKSMLTGWHELHDEETEH